PICRRGVRLCDRVARGARRARRAAKRRLRDRRGARIRNGPGLPGFPPRFGLGRAARLPAVASTHADGLHRRRRRRKGRRRDRAHPTRGHRADRRPASWTRDAGRGRARARGNSGTMIRLAVSCVALAIVTVLTGCATTPEVPPLPTETLWGYTAPAQASSAELVITVERWASNTGRARHGRGVV